MWRVVHGVNANDVVTEQAGWIDLYESGTWRTLTTYKCHKHLLEHKLRYP
jgi:hypothetical protein